MIPKFIHFITGFGNDPFGLIEYVAVASARKHHPDWKIFIWHGDNVGGDWWAKLDELHVQKTWVQTPTHFRGKEVPHHAHRADLLRLPILYAMGGIYLDTDTITIEKPSPEYYCFDRGFCIGNERDSKGVVIGLCNAVMFSSPLHSFVAEWIREYEKFDPSRWGDMSVQKPLELFWKYDYESLCRRQMFSDDKLLGFQPFEFERYWKPGYIENTFFAHLWRTFSKPYMDKVTIESCAKRETAYEYHAAEVLGL
jgi:hypothetical protein